MSEKDKPFTVSDRRHFAPDGRAREDAEPSAADTPAEATPPGETTRPVETAAPVAGAPRESRPAPGAAPVVSFAGFLLSLGAQAAALMAEQDEPADGPSALEAARHVISILEMLKDKTEGRRTPDEDHVLDDLLFQLRMAYVQRQETRSR